MKKNRKQRSEEDQDDSERQQIQQVGAYITIPFILAVSPVVGWFIGHWLDKKFLTTPYLMYLFVFLGLIAGFREVYRIIKKFGNE